MISLYKRCPFKKTYCNKDCALYEEHSVHGCTILEISERIDYACEEIRTLLKAQERIITLLDKGTEEE